MEGPRQVDLVLLDLDGTLIDSEILHFQAYCEAIAELGGRMEAPALTRAQYCFAKHSADGQESYLSALVQMQQQQQGASGAAGAAAAGVDAGETRAILLEQIKANKKRAFAALLEEAVQKKELQMIPGAQAFLAFLREAGIATCIVTHSRRSTFDLMTQAFPCLGRVDLVVTHDDYREAKPSPDGYLRALAHFKDTKHVVGFEDSARGCAALKAAGVSGIVWVTGPGSCCGNFHAGTPAHFIRICDYDAMPWSKIVDCTINDADAANRRLTSFLLRSHDLYVQALHTSLGGEDASVGLAGLRSLLPLVRSCRGRVLITGVGKNGLVAAKSVSTWQSMGLRAATLNVGDLFHGDFGGICSGDLVVYVSNSGDTEELLKCALYIKEHFLNVQASITLSQVNDLASIVDFPVCIGPAVTEIDNLNMAPTTSSVVLMTFLDVLGVAAAQDAGLDMTTFQRMHPGGSLGKRSSHQIDTVVVVASGSGSRLMPMTAYIPKILVSVTGQPFLHRLLDYYSRLSDHVILIVQSNHARLVKFYSAVYLKNKDRPMCSSSLQVDVRTYDKLNGTAATLASTLSSSEFGKNMLITWCDIVPCEILPPKAFERTTVFLHGNECRYTATRDGVLRQLKEGTGGGVIGMWMVRNFRGVRHFVEGQDIADVFVENFGAFGTHEIQTLVDIGDRAKYDAVHGVKSEREGEGNKKKDSTKDALGPCRFFNRVELLQPAPASSSSAVVVEEGRQDYEVDVVRKFALTPHAELLQSREIAWYKEVVERCPAGSSLVPQILATTSPSSSPGSPAVFFDMQRMPGLPIASFLTENPARRTATLVDRVLGALRTFHSVASPVTPTWDVIEQDVTVEGFTKVVARLKEAWPVIAHFGVRSVNGVSLPYKASAGAGFDEAGVESTVKGCVDVLLRTYCGSESDNNTEYKLIHGDCNFSNMLIDPTREEGGVSFIDPRGYFGNTSIYGLPDYDLAKVLYAMSGYDDLNGAMHFGVEISAEGDLTVVDRLQEDWPVEALARFEDRHFVWLVIIYLSLTSYIINDANKVVTAYGRALHYYNSYVVPMLRTAESAKETRTGVTTTEGASLETLSASLLKEVSVVIEESEEEGRPMVCHSPQPWP